MAPDAIIPEGAIVLPTRKSAPPLSPRQRRRQIIDLLAGHLARMPEALVVSSPPEDKTGAGQSCQGVTAEGLKVSRFGGSAPASNAATGSRAEKRSQSGQPAGIRLDVSAEMPLSVSTPGSSGAVSGGDPRTKGR